MGEDEPQAQLCEWIVALIEERADYLPGGPERPARFAPGLPLWCWPPTLARTPDVPVPDLSCGSRRSVGGAPMAYLGARALGRSGSGSSTKISKPIGGWNVTWLW